MTTGKTIAFTRQTFVGKVMCLLFNMLSRFNFLGGLDGKASAYNLGDPGLIPGLGRSPGKENGNLLQCSWASPVAQMVRNLPAMQETWVGKITW